MASSEFPADTYDAVVDEAIAMCGGDLRGAVRALLIANEHLEAELSRLKSFGAVPFGGPTFGGRGYLN
jgi:hypothetical protein